MRITLLPLPPPCFQEDLENCIGIVFIIEKTYLLLRIAGALSPEPLNCMNATYEVASTEGFMQVTH